MTVIYPRKNALPSTPPGVPDDLLADLEVALRDLGPVVGPALAELTVEEVERVLNLLAQKNGQHLMYVLGLRKLAPRRFGRALSEQVCKRLQSLHSAEEQVCAAQLLTLRVFEEIMSQATAEAARQQGYDLPVRWSDTMLRLAVFSHLAVSAVDASVVLWAAERGWLGLDTEESVREAVRAAAVQVVEAAQDCSAESVRDSPDPRARESMEAQTTAPGSTGDPVAAGMTGPQEWEALEEARDNLTAAVRTARDAAERVREALADGRVPGEEDQRVIAGVAPAFAGVLALLEAVGAAEVVPRFDDIREAVTAHVDAERRDGHARARVATVLTLTCPQGGHVADVLADARERAGQLLDAKAWSKSDEEHAQALGLLVELIEVRDRQGKVAELTDVQQRLSTAHAPYAVAAVLHEQIEVATDGADVPAQRNSGTGSGGASAPLSPTPGEIVDRLDQVESVPPSVCAPGADGESSPVAVDGPGEGTDIAAPALPGLAPDAVRASAPMEAGTAEGPDSTQAWLVDAQGTAIAESEVRADQEPSVPSDAAADDSPGEAGEAQVEPTADETRASLDDIALTLARLVSERRFGLAAHLSTAAGRPLSEAATLRLAGAATVLRSRSDKVALDVTEMLRYADNLTAADTDGAPLVLLPALVRAAIVTGEPVVAAELKALSARLSGALAEVAAEVADLTLKGALLVAPPGTVVADVSEAENRLREAIDACRAQLSRPRLRFSRATRMVDNWLKHDGLLGRVLTAIVDETPDAERQAEHLLADLGRKADVEMLIEKADAALRGHGGSAIQGAVRTDVRQYVERSRATVQAWHAAQRSARAKRTMDNAWAFDAVAALRHRLLALRGRVDEALDIAVGRAAPLTRAAALVARTVLDEVFAELEHGGSDFCGPVTADATRILDAELYKLRAVDDDVLDLDALLPVANTTWSDALAFQKDHDGFEAIRAVLDLADQGVLPDAATLTLTDGDRSALAVLEAKRGAELLDRAKSLTAALHQAQGDGALTVVQDVALQELLADAAPFTESGNPRTLAAIRRNLDRLERLLPRYREEAANRLRTKLDELPPEAAEGRAHILRYLDNDNLATAAELAYFLELGVPVPEITADESHLDAFLPAVPEALPAGVTRELVDAVRTRSRHMDLEALDYAGLSPEAAERAAGDLEHWMKLSTTTAIHQINPRADLTPALAILGYEAKRAVPIDRMSGKDYRFYELADVQVTGRAWAPAFGSHIADAGGKLRALLIWGRPPAQLLLSRIAQNPSDDSLLVVHFGTMDVRTRTELAVASQGGKPVMVVDDAALAYLTARGNRRADAATETLLPFSAVNPYIKEKRGRIGWEMFYGRDRERQSILDPQGTQILYGGRGLGKSALLADAGDRFVEQRPGKHTRLYLNLDTIGINRSSALGAAAIWPTVAEQLIRAGVLAEPRRKGPRQEDWQRATEGVHRWLEQDTDRRLLILLDECDRFFEADLPDCTETRRLRGLGEAFRGRAKVVFAGLHSVVRFTRLAPNTPFNQMTQTPTVVGPLAPQFAADLIVHPLRALGFEFSGVDLVNRVLSYCSYQPFLLQIFGSRLVHAMQEKRARAQTPPPYAIESADVDAIEQDHALRSDIRAAFRATLELDDRYNVVANVLAQHARGHGLETRLSDRELRDECDYWWPEGFSRLDSYGFRAYLEEMVGLGVLAPNHDGRGWHLRGPNALRMVGTAQEIEVRLIRANDECRLEETALLESRLQLSGGRSAPLTVNEIHYLLGSGGNQVRVVLGTEATGIGDVETTLRKATGQIAGWTVPPIGSASTHRRELTAGRANERRLLISDLVQGTDKTCRESYERAVELKPAALGASRSVVLVSAPHQLGFWRERLAADTDGDHTVLALRRYDERALQDWAGAHNLCETEERLGRLAEATGGWPYLLDKALVLRDRHPGDQDRVLRDLARWTSEKNLMEEFVETTGMRADDALLRAYAAVVEHLGTGWNLDGDCRAAVQLGGLPAEEAEAALACLEAMQVLDRDGVRLRIEPVLFGALVKLGALPALG